MNIIEKKGDRKRVSNGGILIKSLNIYEMPSKTLWTIFKKWTGG
jgi:hypothetical protein